jgi:hypothetical protein
LFIIFLVYVWQSASTGDNHADRSKKQLEELEEANEEQRQEELAKSNWLF